MANMIERIGVHHCAEIAVRNKWIFREQPVDDIRIDAHMEFVDESGKNRDSIFKNRIISIDISGEFRKELRELSSLVSRNSANLNQIAKVVNSTRIIYKDDIESIKKALQGELIFLSEFREKVSDYIINEVIG